MVTSGLVSVTFRNKTPLEICKLCVKAGLSAIEWGGDVHVPPGDMENADAVRRMCAEHGLEICSYGSYYRVGDDIADFIKCADTAVRLGAPVIRVWCGRKGSADADEEYREFVMQSLRMICAAASERGLVVAPEFHGGTLTDAPESVNRLLDETKDIPNLRFYWQPRWDWSEEVRLATLKRLLPRLIYIHTFTWEHIPDILRHELEKGETMWLKALRAAPDTHALIEFVKNDSDESLLRDAACLNRWIAELGRA